MVLTTRFTAVLVAAGAAALGGALFWARPFSWSQFCLLLVASLVLIVSPARVRAGLANLVRTSRARSEDTIAGFAQRPVRYLLISLWLACAISLAEIGLRTFELIAGKRVLGLGFLWNVPVGYGVLLGGLGVVATVVASRISPSQVLRVIVFCGTYAAIFGWMSLIVRGVHPAASAILAAGVAVQLARMAGRHPYVLHRLARRTGAFLAITVVSIAVGALAWPRWVESRTLAALPPARVGTPNVLLIVLDTVRAKSLGLYGYGRPTSPSLDRFATRGVVFSHAFSTSPWTLPSHGSMFTGRLPHELSGAWLTPIDDTHPTLAEALSAAGYLTAGFVANTTYCPTEFGLARGFAHYEDHPASLTGALSSTSFGSGAAKALNLIRRLGLDPRFGLKSAARVNADLLRWLDNRPPGRPFFAFANYYDAHAAYAAPPEFIRKFSSASLRGDIWSRRLDQWSPEEIRELNDAYDASIAYLDSQIGALLEELEGRGVLDDTVVIITSDHGEQFGEHGLLEHANSLYLPLLHVPLVIVSPPRLPSATRIDTFVSLRDLPSTVLDLIGQPSAITFPGASLARHWSGPAAGPTGAAADFVAEVDRAYDAYPNSYPARQGRMRSLFSGTRHYIHNLGSGREELYDLASDFEEAHDLSASEPLLLKDYRSRLQALLADRGPVK